MNCPVNGASVLLECLSLCRHSYENSLKQWFLTLLNSNLQRFVFNFTYFPVLSHIYGCFNKIQEEASRKSLGCLGLGISIIIYLFCFWARASFTMQLWLAWNLPCKLGLASNTNQRCALPHPDNSSAPESQPTVVFQPQHLQFIWLEPSGQNHMYKNMHCSA